MTRLRLLLLLAGTGTLLMGLPSGAAVRTSPQPNPGVAAGEARALELLATSSRAARTLTYSGTEYVSTWGEGGSSAHVADVSHSPAAGSSVTVRPTAGASAADGAATLGTELDSRLLRLLAEHYVLDVARDGTCAGRPARVVEARRPGVEGAEGVAGRFWLDAASSLVLRREVFDRQGRLARSSAFASLTISPARPEPPALQVVSLAGPAPGELDRLRRDGWQVPTALPGELELFDARLRTRAGQDVLHLSYSDGLSTLSVFAQRGRLGNSRMRGFSRDKVGKAQVWVRSQESPTRVVWGGGGRVFTLLSDAPHESVRAAVSALPHDRPAKTGVLARLARGLSRLAAWLNPFD